ncbi:hypothetical protein [Streptomyces sp. NPDC055036]
MLPEDAPRTPEAGRIRTARRSCPDGSRLDPLSGTAVLNGFPVELSPATPSL